jgi:hypothetical protein
MQQREPAATTVEYYRALGNRALLRLAFSTVALRPSPFSGQCQDAPGELITLNKALESFAESRLNAAHGRPGEIKSHVAEPNGSLAYWLLGGFPHL